MRLAVKMALVLLVLGGAMYLFVFPARTYLDQKQGILAEQRTVAVLRAEDSKLTSESSALQDNATIEQIARQEYGLVKPGQQAFMVLPAPNHPQPPAPPPPKHAAWYSSLEFWHNL
jgi:cell division protein FtsB